MNKDPVQKIKLRNNFLGMNEWANLGEALGLYVWDRPLQFLSRVGHRPTDS